MSAPRGLYTPIYSSLPRHPKTAAAALALRITRHQLIGHLVCLWTWCLDSVSEDRQVLTAEVVALAAEWPEKRAQAFADALADVGFLHRSAEGFIVHEWDEYGGKVAAKQRSDRERKFYGKPPRPPSPGGSSEEVPRNFLGTSRTDETRRDETREDDLPATAPAREPLLRIVEGPPEPSEPIPELQPPRQDVFEALSQLVATQCGWLAPSLTVQEQLLAWAHELEFADVERIGREADDAKAGSSSRGSPWNLIKAIAGRAAVARRAGQDPWAARSPASVAAGTQAGRRGPRAMASPGGYVPTGDGARGGFSTVPPPA